MTLPSADELRKYSVEFVLLYVARTFFKVQSLASESCPVVTEIFQLASELVLSPIQGGRNYHGGHSEYRGLEIAERIEAIEALDTLPEPDLRLLQISRLAAEATDIASVAFDFLEGEDEVDADLGLLADANGMSINDYLRSHSIHPDYAGTLANGVVKLATQLAKSVASISPNMEMRVKEDFRRLVEHSENQRIELPFDISSSGPLGSI